MALGIGKGGYGLQIHERPGLERERRVQRIIEKAGDTIAKQHPERDARDVKAEVRDALEKRGITKRD